MRLASIDVLRAMTMVLMLWVNDFWTLTGVPKWLTHAHATEDYLGFSDIIFPLFLFIVGLSIPHAIQSRLNKDADRLSAAKHIILRSLALLFIGFFMVNYETIHAASMPIGRAVWCTLMATGVFLIWLDWKKSPVPVKWHLPIQITGFVIFIVLAIIYKGGESGELWMTPQWWGILGLIGWAYLFNALVYLAARGNILVMIISWLVLNVLTVIDHSGMAFQYGGFLRYFSTIISGTVPAFTAAGIVATLLFTKLSEKNKNQAYIVLTVLGMVCIVYGLATRPYWGISKIMGTPSWLGICSGIGFILFVIVYLMVDVKKWTGWTKIISPAGTATFTCYMLPYFIYSFREFLGIRLPDGLNAGIVGLIGSFAYALLVVALTGWLEKRRFKLKL